MTILILIIVALWGIVSYYSRNKSLYLVALVFVISSGFNLIPVSVYNEDITLVMAFVAIFYELFRGKKIFSTKNDPVGKIIIIILIYYLIQVIWTVIQGRETLIFALKVYRRDLFYLFYFVFKRFSILDVKKAYKPLLIFTITGGVLYYLQFVGIHILSNASDATDIAKGGFVRYVNIPMLGIPLMIYFIVKKKEVKFWHLLFFIGFLIMPMIRGGIIAAFIVFSYYIFKSNKVTSYKHIAMKLIVLILLFSPVLLFRFVNDNERGNAMQDIKSASSINDFSDFDYSSGGTFTFRIAMAIERIDYMLNNPKTILTGIGTIHEQSPNNKFEFYIGTPYVDKKGEFVRQMIDTEDIAYVSHLFRYGIIYLFLFVAFILISFKRLKPYAHIHAIGAVGYILFLMMVINSLSSDVFSFLRLMLVPLLCLALIKTCKKDELIRVCPIK